MMASAVSYTEFLGGRVLARVRAALSMKSSRSPSAPDRFPIIDNPLEALFDMRFRLNVVYVAIAALAAVGGARAARAQISTTDGLMPGDYLRVSGGVVSPISPQGSLRDWNSGPTINVTWENWQPGSQGVGAVAFGLGIGYTMLPLNQQHFLSAFRTVAGDAATAATSSSAGIIDVATNVRIRIPVPYITPSVNLGFGFMDWRPAAVHYTAPSGDGSAQQEHRSGLELSIGGGLDKTVYDRWAIFGEALYTYGFTSFGQGLATPTGTCTNSSECDVLKNTSIGTLRGGLRVRVGR